MKEALQRSEKDISDLFNIKSSVIKNLIYWKRLFWDFWGENGKNRERCGELIQRVGLGNFLEEIEVEPLVEMVAHPRENPYVFYEEYFEEGDDDEEEEDDA
ncbi:hypothetical protein HOE49_02035 [Candidatus Peregrinibacteria bacterium]|nr:hypothetical protein [Candidatus Peregrinibacteria bacterium]